MVIPRVTLNANQRRHYEVLFGGLEASLSQLEAVADPAATGDTYMVVEPDLPPGFLGSVRPLLDALRVTLRQLAVALELAPRSMSQRQICRALLTSQIIRIEESSSDRLQGYGAMDPSVRDGLDPVLKTLRADLRRIAALVNAPAGGVA